MNSLNQRERLKIGILFNYSQKWMGGIVYIINLVKTLNFLDDENKPEIFLFYKTDLKRFADGIDYPYLNLIEWKFPELIQGYMLSWFARKNYFVNEILNNYDLNALYPVQDYPVKMKSSTKLISWYPDLQHKYYPKFFTARKVLERNFRLRLMLNNSGAIIVSSQDVANDFKNFYKLKKTLRLYVYRFVSVIEDISGINIDDLREKYQLPDKYFLVSNQFPEHKNHVILFKTLIFLKQLSKSVHFVITGRFPEKTRSPYIRELHELIEINQLQCQLSFVGIIPRTEQLAIMKYSQAVIQPSLFEGWSTVIEDARSLQVPVVASNIKVNIEQLGESGIFFNPLDQKELASILINFPQRDLNAVFYEDYTKRCVKAAKEFIEIFK